MTRKIKLASGGWFQKRRPAARWTASGKACGQPVNSLWIAGTAGGTGLRGWGGGEARPRPVMRTNEAAPRPRSKPVGEQARPKRVNPRPGCGFHDAQRRAARHGAAAVAGIGGGAIFTV